MRDAGLQNARNCLASLAGDIDETTALLLEAIGHTDTLIGLHDADDRLRFANSAFREAVFVGDDESPTWEEIMRRNFALRRGTILHTDDIDAWIRSAGSRRGKSAKRRFETDLHDGRWLMVSETVLPNGWNLFVGVEITDLFQSEQSLRQDRDIALKASQTDDLTGVSNRRHIMACLEDLLSGRSAFGEVIGCACLIDLDLFKDINDKFGHPTGDRVLMRFAEVVRQSIRPKDSFGRIGGEEFLLNLPATTETESLWILKRLLTTVSAAPLLPSEPDLFLTFSAGLSCFKGGESSGLVYRRCDKALYLAKAGGRNQVHMADALPMTPPHD